MHHQNFHMGKLQVCIEGQHNLIRIALRTGEGLIGYARRLLVSDNLIIF